MPNAPDTVISNSTLPILELFRPFSMDEKFVSQVWSQTSGQLEMGLNMLLGKHTLVGGLPTLVEEEVVEEWNCLDNIVARSASKMETRMKACVVNKV